MEGGEVQRDVGTEIPDHPASHPVQLRVGVVQPGDEQSGDLQPDAGLMTQIHEGVEYRSQLAAADAAVEGLREALEVDVGRVHVGEHLPPRLGADVAGGDRDRHEPSSVGCVGAVDGVLHEGDRVVVGEGDAAAAEPPRRLSDRLRRGSVDESVDLAGLADVPVLAEPTGEVAARRAEGEDRAPGQEVVERLLLDRVDAEAARPAVGGEHDPVVPASPDEAEAALPLTQPAGARAEVTLDSPVGEPVPVSGRHRALHAPMVR